MDAGEQLVETVDRLAHDLGPDGEWEIAPRGTMRDNEEAHEHCDNAGIPRESIPGMPPNADLGWRVCALARRHKDTFDALATLVGYCENRGRNIWPSAPAFARARALLDAAK